MKKDFYSSLKEKLDQEYNFPILYMFKFIIQSDNQKIALLSSLFGSGAQLSFNKSSKGKFTSITIREVMLSSDEIINKYKEAGKIEGVIAL